MVKVKHAVCHGATRCPCEKGLGAAQGQVTTKLGLELGAPLPPLSPPSSLALPEQNGLWAVIPGCKDWLGRTEEEPHHWGMLHCGGVLSQSSPSLINSKH